MAKPVYIYITPFFPTPERHFGSYAYDFVVALKATGRYDVQVFVPGGNTDYDFEGIRVYRFPVRTLPSNALPLLFARRNADSFLRKVKAVGIDVGRVAVCHGNTANFSIYPLAIKKLNPKCKAVLQYHDLAGIGLRMGRLRHFWPHKVINYLMLRRQLDQIDCHLYISEACRRSFESFPRTGWSVYSDYRRLGRGMRPFRPVRVKDSYVLYNGVDTKLFNATKGRPSHEGFVIGSIGNFIEVKRQIDLVQAVHRLVGRITGLRLEFLGTNGLGNYRADVERYIAEHHLEAVVTFSPHVAHNQLADAYRRWDLFVLPSVFEGFGCVYTESWCCGTPFIACQGQGIEDMLPQEDRNVWLAEPYNVEDLARKMLGYYERRPLQRLLKSMAMDEIIPGYLAKLEEVKA